MVEAPVRCLESRGLRSSPATSVKVREVGNEHRGAWDKSREPGAVRGEGLQWALGLMGQGGF